MTSVASGSSAGAAVAALLALWPPQPAATGAPWPVQFHDVAERAGLRAPSIYGGVDKKRFIIETNGAGVAWIDLDDDGWVDAVVLGGSRLAAGARHDDPAMARGESTTRVYRNRGDGTFADVTERSGLGRTAWASSICAGDYDNDGAVDVHVTAFGTNRLYRNRGDGRFDDRSAAAGLPVTGTRWGSGCSFFDYDRDGDLDLFVANYLAFDLATATEPGQGVNCLWKGIPVNCGPKGLPTDTNLLYRNLGDGRFADVSEASGIARVRNRYPMSVVAADLDEDGWVDLYVASDSTAAIQYRNNQDGTFSDVAVTRGTAFSENGMAQAGMGAAAGDIDGDGRLDLFKTHFADDIPALFRAVGGGRFEEVAMAVGPGRSEPVRRVGRGDRRSRQRRLAGSALRDRQRLPRGRAADARLPPQEPPDRLPEPRRRVVRGRELLRAVPAPPPRARAGGPPSETSTTTATRTCWS